MTAPRVSVKVRELPVCSDCGSPLRRAASITAKLCCCARGTCNEPEPFGCVVCGAFLVGRNDEVLGCCSRCAVVTL